MFGAPWLTGRALFASSGCAVSAVKLGWDVLGCVGMRWYVLTGVQCMPIVRSKNRLLYG